MPRRRRWSSTEVRRLAEATGSAIAGRYLAAEANSTAFEVGPSLRFGMTAKKLNKNKNGEENSRATAGSAAKAAWWREAGRLDYSRWNSGVQLCPHDAGIAMRTSAQFTVTGTVTDCITAPAVPVTITL